MRANLREAGFTLRPVHSKAPWRQSNVESSVRSIKRILKASFLQSLEGMTPISFVPAVQMSVYTVNLRPVCLIPYEAASPGELNAVSPTALRGPDSAGWPALGRSRDFTGQMACLQKQQESFRHKWRTFYSKVVRRTQKGEGFSVNDVVLILDLSITNRQPPFPALGIVKKFIDKEHGQAEIHYNFKGGCHSVVNRPIFLISKIVSSTDVIPPQGLLFDPLIVNDFLQQEDAERLDAELASGGGGGHAGQQVDHDELGAVQDTTNGQPEEPEEHEEPEEPKEPKDMIFSKKPMKKSDFSL